MTAVRARDDVAWTRGHVRTGTARLLGAVATLDGRTASTASLLPGWSRAHVVAHVARNADGLGRLLRWAGTGVPTPMYRDARTREADIEASAAQPWPLLLADLADTAQALERALEDMPDTAWQARVQTLQGRSITAAVVPWLRVREVWLHTVDLAVASTDPHDLPGTLVDELLDDVTWTLARSPGCPAADLVATDRDHGWTLRPPTADDAPVPTVAGPAAALLLWLTGRTAGAGLTGTAAPLPVLPAWL